MDDFTVVLQPFYRNTQTPRLEDGDVDYSYFAADCFHHSDKGQEAAGEALWNNMVEPVGEKRTEWAAGEPMECPTHTRTACPGIWPGIWPEIWPETTIDAEHISHTD